MQQGSDENLCDFSLKVEVFCFEVDVSRFEVKVDPGFRFRGPLNLQIYEDRIPQNKLKKIIYFMIFDI